MLLEYPISCVFLLQLATRIWHLSPTMYSYLSLPKTSWGPRPFPAPTTMGRLCLQLSFLDRKASSSPLLVHTTARGVRDHAMQMAAFHFPNPCLSWWLISVRNFVFCFRLSHSFLFPFFFPNSLPHIITDSGKTVRRSQRPSPGPSIDTDASRRARPFIPTSL